MKDALGLTSDRVYQWRLLLEEYGPKIVYIKCIHNIIADAISQLEYDPSGKLSSDKDQVKLKKRSKTKLVGSLKTLVQTRNRRHHQT
jgi:hypothetical protein